MSSSGGAVSGRMVGLNVRAALRANTACGYSVGFSFNDMISMENIQASPFNILAVVDGGALSSRWWLSFWVLSVGCVCVRFGEYLMFGGRQAYNLKIGPLLGRVISTRLGVDQPIFIL